MDDAFDYNTEYVQDIFYYGEQTVGPLNEIGAIAGSPNFITNWDFRKPVNRNGELQYSVSSDPRITIDRWYASGNGVVEIANSDFGNCIHLSGIDEFHQDIDMSVHNYPDFNMMRERYMTFSVLARASNQFIGPSIIGITVGGRQVSKPARIVSNSHEQLIVCTGVIPLGSSTITVSIYPSGAALDIYAVKLEMGKYQSLVHQEYRDQEAEDQEVVREEYWRINDIPNYELQYLLCNLRSHITDDWDETIQSNQNLLDNWYFINPINQKNQLAYTITDEPIMYAIDRWIINTSVTLTDGGVQIGHELWQPIDVDANKGLDGKKVTISAMIDGELYSSSGIFGEEIVGEYIALKDQDGLYSFVFSGVDGTIEAAKLELGNMQTLAHKYRGDEDWVLNDLPPNRALELAKCQRYQKYIANIRVIFGDTANDHTLSTSIPLGEMRDIPSKIKCEYLVIPYDKTIVYREGVVTFYCVDGQNVSIDITSLDPELAGDVSGNIVEVQGFFADANLYKEK